MSNFTMRPRCQVRVSTGFGDSELGIPLVGLMKTNRTSPVNSHELTLRGGCNVEHSALNSHATTTVRIRVEKLMGYHAGLVRVLREAGLSANQLSEIFSNHLRVQCSRCGIRVAGEEIMNVLAGDT